MSASAAYKAMAAFEAFDARARAAAAARAAALPGVDPAKMLQLSEKLGGTEGIAAFVAAMPTAPSADEIVGKYTADELETLINTTMAGNLTALAALAETGCARDADRLRALTDHFAGKEAKLGSLISEGGMGAHPEALAALFRTGCQGNPADLEALCDKFDDAPKRDKLSKTLQEGGLGQAPAALGKLATEGNGDLLVKFTTDIPPADLPTLNALLKDSGLGGHPPENPGTLLSVVKDGLGGEPKDLKHLHAAFGAGGMDDLSSMLHALNGKTDGDDAVAGPRMKALTDAFARRDPTLNTPALQLAKLKTPFFDTMKTKTTGARVPPEASADGVAAMHEVAQKALQPAALVGALGMAMPLDTAAAALRAGLASADDRATLAACLEALGQAGAVADHLRRDTAARPADAEAATRTDAAVLDADTRRAALEGKPDGGTLAEIAALSKAAELCFAVAQDEPDPAPRATAITAGERAVDAAGAAMKRLAALGLVTAGAGPEQMAALAASASAQARVDADPNASATRKAVMQGLAEAGAETLAVSVQAQALADPAAAQAAAAAALTAGATDAGALDDGKRALAQATAKTAAQDATRAATTLSEQLAAAPLPIDPALIRRASAAAAAAMQAGLACDDQPTLVAALTAGRDLSKAVAERLASLAAAVRTEYALARDEAGPGVLAASDADAALAALAQTTAGNAANKPDLDAMALAAREAGLALGELAVFEATPDPERNAAARASTAAAGALAGQSAADAETAANAAAVTATNAAQVAADALTGPTVAKAPPAPPTLIPNALILAASDAAEKALAAARATPDTATRNAAVTQAKRAAAEAARAISENAKALTEYAAQTTAEQARVDGTAQRADQDAFVTAFAGNVPPLPGTTEYADAKAAIDTAMASVDKAGAARLAEIAADDAAVKAQRTVAARAASAAASPGAGDLERLRSQLADTRVQRTLAEAAYTKAKAKVDAMPLVPVTDITAPPLPTAPVPVPAAPTAADLQQATALCQAAMLACHRWAEAAVRLVEAAKGYKLVADAIAAPSPDEALQKAGIDTIHAADAPQEKTDADARVNLLGGVNQALLDKADAVMKETNLSRLNITNAWTGAGNLAPGGANAAANPALENAVGMATVMSETGFKQLGGGAVTPPMPQDAMIATAANLEKQSLAAFTDADPLAPPPSTDTAQMHHMLGRHCRAHQTMEPPEIKDETDLLVGKLVAARTTGGSRHPANGRDLITAPENKAKKLSRNDDTTSLWPEGATAAKIQAGAVALMATLRASYVAPATLEADVFGGNRVFSTHSVTIDGKAILTRIVLSATAATGPLKIITLIPLEGDSVAFKDMHVAKQALGI